MTRLHNRRYLMKQSGKPNAPEDDKSNAPWSEMQALELWKHFGSVGTQDKNTMVTVESLLLGFSAAIIGYYVGTNLLTFQPLHVEDPVKGIYIALLGVGI